MVTPVLRFGKRINNYLKNILSFAIPLFLASCATTGSQSNRYLVEGNAAAIRGDYSTAVTKFEQALQNVDQFDVAQRNLGIVLVKSGDYTQAKQYLLKASKRYLRDPEVFYFLGEACRGLEEYPQSLHYYQKAQVFDRTDLRIQKAMAWAMFKMNYYDRALDVIEPVMSANPLDMQARLISANVYNGQNRFHDALKTLSIAEKANVRLKSHDKISAETERVLVLATLAESYIGIGKCDKAQGLIAQVLKTRPFLSEALTLSARCYLKSQDARIAQQRLERALVSNPLSAEAHFYMGKALQKSSPDKAAKYYQKFLKMSQGNRKFKKQTFETKQALNELKNNSN